jgi:starch phosphorylase
MTIHVREFHVAPRLPGPIDRLLELAKNLWWCWHPEAVDLFQRIDTAAFAACGSNPVRLLGDVDPRRLEQLAHDASFRAHLDRVLDAFDRDLRRVSWFEKGYPEFRGRRVAYFSAEFGIHECLPLYSGGLGVLAGDLLKSASDLGVPAVGVGIAYRFGYFQQQINHDGWQTELYPENDFSRMPMELARGSDGKPLVISVAMGARTVRAQVWRVQVGRVPLHLLDTNLPDAPEQDRRISARLYDSDKRVRLEQEILLGIGGVHALHGLGIEIDAYHMNEGHTTFLTLEQAARVMEREQLSFEDARHLVAAANTFTTHTPVPAGHDAYDPEWIREQLATYASRLRIPVEQLVALGQREPGKAGDLFNMTVLGLRMARHKNGVSKLHGEVTREMWKDLWPMLQVDELPITHVTNGVHSQSWLSAEMRRLFDRYFEPEWLAHAGLATTWEKVREIPDAELWRSRCRLRQRLVNEVRSRLLRQAQRGVVSPAQLRRAERALDPEVLTVGFCRRFATYKRSTLLFRDLERLKRICRHSERPIQFVFAGKSHPQDEPGKKCIREIVRASWGEELMGRVVFVENYDIGLARILVQGVDVWLNNPRRPYEASGTSGMKAVLNGGLHMSILDGWWCEGWRGDNGWAIGNGHDSANPDIQDQLDSLSAYDLLEHEVAAAFYERDKDGIPGDWCRMMKASIGGLARQFSSDRMLEEYASRFYAPALRVHDELGGHNRGRMRALSDWWRMVNQSWERVRIADVKVAADAPLALGERLPVAIALDAGPIDPAHLVVEVVHGPLDGDGRIREAAVAATSHAGNEAGLERYTATVPCSRSGKQGLAVRVRPGRAGSEWIFDQTLVRWG